VQRGRGNNVDTIFGRPAGAGYTVEREKHPKYDAISDN